MKTCIKEKTRIHHQHLRLGEERPGLLHKGMKKIILNKSFFNDSFSTSRMKPYFVRYPNDEKSALRHYAQNIQLSESFYPSLSIYEVALRNTVIKQLERVTGRKDWYAFFRGCDTFIALNKQIDVAIEHIARRGEAITADKINGELTMGFWVLLFNAKYERYLWKDLRYAFPCMPKSKRQRKNISSPLNEIRALRNRVFHNEPISWSLARLEGLHDIILEVCSWINPKLPIWIKTVEHFDKTVNRVKHSWYGGVLQRFNFAKFIRN